MYGGVFDLFYKLSALQSQGIHIHLHCFKYGDNSVQDELNKYCHSVQYYERESGHKAFSPNIPYIVASRKNEILFNNLLKDDYPILMEGVHCTYLLNDARFEKRKKFVRLHNVEYQYYHYLSQSSNSILKKIYYKRESSLLKEYEQSLVSKATAFWGVSNNDVQTYREEFHCTTIDLLPPYLPTSWQVKCLPGKGNYCLYHGDLSVDVNEKAATWLLEEVFSNTSLPLVIAGKNPSSKLQRLAHSNPNTCIVANPSEKEMQDMIMRAHINILPSFSYSGIKLKLLNALFNGRFCIANAATVAGSGGLEELCCMADTAKEMRDEIAVHFNRNFEEGEIDKRRKILLRKFNNEANAKQQVKWIWGEENH